MPGNATMFKYKNSVQAQKIPKKFDIFGKIRY